MILIKLITLSIIFGACCSSKAIDLCSIEQNKYWYMTDYNDHDLSSRAPNNRRSFRNMDAEKPVTFSLYTWLNPTKPQILKQDVRSSLIHSNFNKRNATVFLIHGWLGNGNNTMNLLLIEAFLKDTTANVIVVDWGYLASFNYVTSTATVAGIGVEVGMFIKWLTCLGLSYEKVHIVGFSLGGHIAGIAGRTTGSRVRRITALDPAGILWSSYPQRLVKTDAQYVEVIHTNARLYGLMAPCGDADFYPNGGRSMPNCWLNMCSHSMAYEYMAESVKYNNIMAQSCNELSNVIEDHCSGGSYPMGNSDLSKNISGLFRVIIISGRRSIVQIIDSENYDKELCY